jgi:hypothetical protein
MWLSSAIGLQDRWWAGISAVVATADTLGATVGTATLRIAATLVGLAVGLAAVALSAHGVLVAGHEPLAALVSSRPARAAALRDAAREPNAPAPPRVRAAAGLNRASKRALRCRCSR